jgi:hypothetical protein
VLTIAVILVEQVCGKMGQPYRQNIFPRSGKLSEPKRSHENPGDFLDMPTQAYQPVLPAAMLFSREPIQICLRYISSAAASHRPDFSNEAKGRATPRAGLSARMPCLQTVAHTGQRGRPCAAVCRSRNTPAILAFPEKKCRFPIFSKEEERVQCRPGIYVPLRFIPRSPL